MDGATLAEVEAFWTYAFGLEILRAALGEEVQRDSLAGTAKRLRVRVDTLRSFLNGGEPSRRVWEAGTELSRDRPPPLIHPETVALNLLTDWYPVRIRADVRPVLARAMVEACEAGGLDVPAGLRAAAAGW